MTVDIPTILILLALVCGTVGAIFLSGWLTGRGSDLDFRIAAAMLPITLGVVLILLRGRVPDLLSIDFANALCLLGIGFAWSVGRRFDDQDAPVGIIVAGAAIWLLACSINEFRDSLAWRVGLVSFIGSAYAIAIGIQFLRPGKQGVHARTMIAVLCLLHGAVVLARGLYWLGGFASPDPFHGNLVQGLFLVEPVAAVICFGILGMSLVRARSEAALRITAETDPLTGVLNRGALIAHSERAVEEARRLGEPVTMLLFDLDHFKSINDRFGHLAGDRTLCCFARIAAGAIRSNDLFGRIGGEEFVAVLSGAGLEVGQRIAERIRLDFAAAAEIDGVRLPATVSVGVAEALPFAERSYDALLSDADAALYQAKRAGRDRVVGRLALAS
jgi:diguanylate cyclase (GGDEF)-like protein